MKNIIAFDVCAMVIATIIIGVNIRKSKLNLLQHKIFIGMSLMLIISTFFSIISLSAAANSSIYSSAYINLIVTVSIIADGLVPLFFVLYTLALLDLTLADSKSSTKCLIIVPLVIEAGLLLFSGGRFIFRLGDDGRVEPLLISFLLAAVSVYYVLYAIFLCHSYRNAVEKRVFSVHTAAGALIIVGIAVRLSSLDFVSSELLYAFGLLLIQLMAERAEDYIDSVTEIPNGAAFRKCFEINRKTKEYNEVYILYVENIKLLNITIGFEKVNTMLKSIASYLYDLTFQNVYYTELGTFAMMPKLFPSEKDAFFHDIKSRFSKVWETGGSDILVSMRIMEIKLPSDADSYEKVYAYADFLRSCNNATSEVISASSVALRDNSRILLVESCIKRALEENGFVIYYQPIYSTAEKKIVSAEALIRLIDPQYGFISPAEFIPISEENGTIIQIGKSVLQQVFNFVSENDIEKMGMEYIEINLSVIQCMQNNLAQSIIELATNHDVDSRKINLEITETAAAERPVMLMKNMKVLVDHFYSFSLDDFGTGYSNISSMVDMPLEIIKFDKSIIDRAKVNSDGKILLESLAAMVKKMGKKIVAEGVETEDQLRELEAMGIDYIQGFYFSRPLPANDFVSFVEKFNNVAG